jgi:hypothetical protein
MVQKKSPIAMEHSIVIQANARMVLQIQKMKRAGRNCLISFVSHKMPGDTQGSL